MLLGWTLSKKKKEGPAGNHSFRESHLLGPKLKLFPLVLLNQLHQQTSVPRRQSLIQLLLLTLFQLHSQPGYSCATAAFRYIEECPVAEPCAQHEV